jgi:regulator of nucleoside diphosphate kinase
MTQSSNIIITQEDARRLRALLNERQMATYAESVQRLSEELERATIVAELPEDVIALDSTVELDDLVTNETLTFTLVLPDEADLSEGRISILAPLGMALLGYRVGDEIEWPVPGGTARVRIRKHLGRRMGPESAKLAV